MPRPRVGVSAFAVSGAAADLCLAVHVDADAADGVETVRCRRHALPWASSRRPSYPSSALRGAVDHAGPRVGG